MKVCILIAFLIAFLVQPVNAFTGVQEFKSEAELREWTQDHQIGVLIVGDGQDSRKQDCDDYAEMLCTWAECDGYKMWVCPVRHGYVYDDYVYSRPGFHVGCWTWIGNEMYYIEPALNNKITKLSVVRD